MVLCVGLQSVIVAFLVHTINILFTCADPESFAKGCPNHTTFFVVAVVFFALMRKEDQNTTIKASYHRPASESLFRASGGPTRPTLNASLVIQQIPTSIAKEPYIFVIYQGVRTLCFPRLDLRMVIVTLCSYSRTF